MATNNSCNYKPTNHAVQVGATNGGLTSLAVGTNGQVLIGSTGADPVFAALTSTGGSITYTTGAGTLNLDVASFVSTTYTPALAFGGASVGITYTTQAGTYIRIGNMVFVMIYIVLSNKGSSTGNATINLPLSAVATNIQTIPFLPNGLSFVTSRTPVSYTTSSSVTLNFALADQGGITNLTNTAFANNSTFSVTGTYLV